MTYEGEPLEPCPKISKFIEINSNQTVMPRPSEQREYGGFQEGLQREEVHTEMWGHLGHLLTSEDDYAC